MSKKLITACVAALALAACDDSKPVPSKPVATRAEVRSTPITAPAAKDGGPKAATPTVVAGPVDAGIDPLALPHEAPGVDHLARAQQLKSDGDAKGALTEARRAVFSSPTDEEALELAARLARQVGKPQLAAEAWGRLAAMREGDALPLIQQARALHQAKDFAGAVIAGREAIGRDAENAEGHHAVGLAQLSMGELTGAIASFKKVLELEPDHGWALNNLGFAYLRANENEKAVEVLEQAAEKLPTVAYVHNNLGVALERVGRKDEAKAAYQQAMDLSPKYVKARVNAARVAKAEAEPELDVTPLEPETASDVPHPKPEQPAGE